MDWLYHLLNLSYDRSLSSLVTVAVIIGVWRAFIMILQYIRPNSVRKYYPIYTPITITLLVAALYIPVVKTLPVIYPKYAFFALGAVLLVIAILLVWQAFKYVGSLLPGGTTPPCKWYKAWPLRILRGTLPFTLTWVLSMLVTAVFLRQLAVTMQYLADAGYTAMSGGVAKVGSLGDRCMWLADFFMHILPVVVALWIIINLALLAIRKTRSGMQRLANRGTGGHP